VLRLRQVPTVGVHFVANARGKYKVVAVVKHFNLCCNQYVTRNPHLCDSNKVFFPFRLSLKRHHVE
jgi:hypothetical protein